MQKFNNRAVAATVPMAESRRPGWEDMPGANTKAIRIADAYPTPRDGVEWKCASHPDPEMFYPDTSEGLMAARSFCSDCPAHALCFELGSQRGEYGVWGGVHLEAGREAPVRGPERGPMRRRDVVAIA